MDLHSGAGRYSFTLTTLVIQQRSMTATRTKPDWIEVKKMPPTKQSSSGDNGGTPATERATCSCTPGACQPTSLDEDLRAIFNVVQDTTGHDFSSYKTNTVLRRIERRMTANEVGGIGTYIALLRENPQEAHALCRDILIGVTGFFRDPEAFETLASKIIPRLCADRGPDDPVRIWHACCASGEEVYSMAILIREYLDRHRLHTPVQLFATDIDELAVAQARAGIYEEASVAGLGEERLRTLFTRKEGRWQVAKSLREMVVFAHHSLIKDPPFSRLDLLVCRNFLIYLNPDLQKRVISLFYQVVKPGGFLFLGSAESVGPHSDQFAIFDKKWKIFQRREGEPGSRISFPLTASVRMPTTNRPERSAGQEGPSPGAVAERLLMERYAPPCVVVNERYEVVHVSTRSARFLEVPVGEPTRDILKMAREELRPALRAAIYKGFAENRQVSFRGVKVADGAGELLVNLLVEPLKVLPACEKLLMVVLEPAASPRQLPAAPGDETSRETLIRQMEEQLRITHDQLQATTEQLETSNEGFLSANEELISINEEFQSANEELQSTNEELETSKEELHALNEELVTLNAELQGKVEDLNLATSNMENLLSSSEIATIYLDERLNLTGFTPAAALLFNLIAADRGRPFRHFAGKIDWPTLTHDAQTVLSGEPYAEREVTTLDDDRCFLKRIFPYRAPEGRIDGIVVTLIDITERKKAEEALLRAKEEWERTFDSVPDLIALLDGEHRIIRTNKAMAGRLGVTPEQCPGLVCYRQVHGAEGPPETCPHSMTLADGREHTAEVYEERLGGHFLVTTTPLRDERGTMTGTVHVARDITGRKKSEAALQESEEMYRSLFGNMLNGFAYCRMLFEGGAPSDFVYLKVNEAFERQTGLRDVEGRRVSEVIPGIRETDRSLFEIYGRVALTQKPENVEIYVAALREWFAISVYSPAPEHFVTVFDVITERKRSEEEHARLAAIVESSDDAIIGQELDGTITAWNRGAERLFGYRAGELVGRPVTLLVPPELQAEEISIQQRLADGERIDHYETVRLARDGRRIEVSISVSPIRDGEGRISGLSKIARDITERKHAEMEKEATVEFLRLVNESATTSDLIRAAAGFFQRQSGCEALGIRLKEGEDFPYHEVRGFPQEFVLLENELCCRDASGNLLRDDAGNPEIACMCGNVICGRFDTSKPFFTQNGSFWSNCTTGLLASTTEADRQARTRNRCNGEGYESVALIPLNFGAERLGLLQLNDTRSGMFTPQGIALWERLAGYLAVALSKFRAEEALHRSDEQFRTLADAMPQLSWMANADGWIFWYNRRWFEYTGTTAQQMEGWGWQTVHDPEALPRVLEKWQSSIASGEPFDMVFPLKGADGLFRPFLTRVMPVCDQSGRVVRWFGTNTDISEQRDTEQALRASQERYRSLFDQMIEGFCVIEVLFDAGERPVDYRFLEINPAFEAQTGLHGAQGKLMRELAPEHEAHWFEIYGKVALTGEPVRFVNEAKALGRWYDVSAYRVYGAESRKVAILFNDITESKSAEMALRESERRYSALFANKISGMAHCRIITDEQGRPVDYRILQINEAYERIIGVKKGDIEGHRVKEVFPDIEKYAFDYIGIYGKIALEGGETKFEEFFEATGQYLSIYAYSPLPGEFAAIFTDVTERRQEEVELQQAKEMAESATRSKSMFLANMSHELRTPMTGVLGMLDLVLSGNLDAEVRERICLAHTSARSLIRILNDILDMSKIEAGKFSIEERPFALRGCMEQTFNILLPVARNKRLDFSFQVADDVPEKVVGDQTRIKQVLTNLAGNAIKFTEKGKVEIQVTVGGGAPGGKREVTFSVTDTGIGIPELKKNLLFHVFSQVDESHSREYGGTGLGLAISKEIVERMGGRISFSSQEGKGSTFFFTILAGAAGSESGHEPVSTAGGAGPADDAPRPVAMIKPRLLIAEDDPTIRQILGSMLSLAQYEVDFAENGQRAVEMWEGGAFNLILMDVQMPRQNGFEATAAIREKERSLGGHIPIVAMTAHAGKEDQERCLDAGMDAYISKPIDFKLTLQVIGETLELQRPTCCPQLPPA